ncbi:MAG: signal peptidase [Pseudonocardiales bacterium]|nr:signal peptidase [Pseudonocardiales bacterium]
MPDTTPPAVRPRRVRLFALVAAVALAADAISKAIVAANLGDNPAIRTLGGAVYLQETRNSGAAFSLGTGATVVLTVVALAVVVFILRTAGRMRSAGWAVALGLVLGGALGNLADRMFRAPGVGRGHVVDWISLFGPDGEHWPIFNLADSAIVCGAVLSAVLALRGIDIDGRGARSHDGSSGHGSDGSGSDGSGSDGSGDSSSGE